MSLGVKDMSKKRRQQVQPDLEPDDAVVYTATEHEEESILVTWTDIEPTHVPKPRAYVPSSCSACTALRPAGTNYSRIYGMSRHDNATVRYCRCSFCGNTFKEIE